MSAQLHGVLVVDKPAGMTSAAVVAEVKRRLRARRVGHTGTLDPMATGVLPLCLGEGTKLATFLLAEDKAYRGELLLGVETDTLDADGRVTARDPAGAAAVDRAALVRAMAGFLGAGEQVPPMFSALKQGGRRLHDMARRGEIVSREPRPIRIDRFDLLEWQPPRARFEVECGKGTYIRSLVSDLGAKLGCGAHLTALRRTRSGRFGLEGAVELAEITDKLPPNRVIAPAAAVAHLAAFAVPERHLAAVANGRRLPWQEIDPAVPAPAGRCVLLDPAGRLLAVAGVTDGLLEYARVFRYDLT